MHLFLSMKLFALLFFFSFPLAKMYSLSHLWLGAVGIGAVFVIGWLVSVATSKSLSHCNQAGAMQGL